MLILIGVGKYLLPSGIDTFSSLPFVFVIFSVAETHVVSRTFVTTLVAADIQRREERGRRRGGIGTAIMLIQCGSLSQVMPVDLDPPSKISRDAREDWAERLHRFVELDRSHVLQAHIFRLQRCFDTVKRQLIRIGQCHVSL